MDDAVVSLVLEKPVAGGRSLARLEGQVVLVSGGIPGERVRVALERRGKGVAFGRVTEILEASPDRIAAYGDPRCGGLVFGHVTPTRQRELKREIVQDALHRIGRLRDLPPIEVVGSPDREWRLRARLHTRGRDVGFFLEGTHTLCDAAPSGQMVPGLLDLARDAMARLHPGIVGSIEAVVVTETLAGDARAVHLELSRPWPRHGEVWIDQEPPACQGVSVGLSASRHPATVAGQPRLREAWSAMGVESDRSNGLVRHAAAFFQGNRALVPALVRHVLARVPDGRAVVDLYAGVGLFGLAAAARDATGVICVEGDAIAAEDLVVNAEAFGPRVRAVRGEVDAFVRESGDLLGDAFVVVDPPRVGLAAATSAVLAEARVAGVVYVSCDPATLARDLQVLTQHRLRVRDITVFDLFPATAHVETVVSLEPVG